MESTDISKENEQRVERYFAARKAWTVTRLDLGEESAADYRVCYPGHRFLCEVKTVESVRANIPYAPSREYFLELRRKRQIEIEQWKAANQDKKLILLRGDWDFVYGEEAEFIERHGRRSRHTEDAFVRFTTALKDFLEQSSIGHLPYRFRLDSDDVYTPTLPERDALFRWLVREIEAIAAGRPSRYWNYDGNILGQVHYYSAFYPIHRAQHPSDTDSQYQLQVYGPIGESRLVVSTHCYGTLNLDAITRNVQDGMAQLEKSAAREPNTRIPRIIALAFAVGIPFFNWEQLTKHIRWLLRENPTLSAIAVLRRTPDGTPPPTSEGSSAWLDFMRSTEWVDCFIVFHNPWLREAEPLDGIVFDDGQSVQFKD
jgi:hypothetical protein